MKFYRGCITAAAAIFAATAAQAQVPMPYRIGAPPYTATSDFRGPYAEIGPDALPPRYGPTLLPPREVYAIVRESGFAPLGSPRQRGLVYTIGVINRDGDDGRLIVDARDGRILRFMPAFRMSDTAADDLTARYGPVGPLPPPPADAQRGSRPPLNVPRLASREIMPPLPKAKPHPVMTPKPLAAKPVPAPAQRAAAIQPKPAVAPAPAPAAATPVEAKPAENNLQPTQDLPAVQDLE